MDDDLRDYFQEGQLARDKTGGGVTISIIEERKKVKRKEKIVDEQY